MCHLLSYNAVLCHATSSYVIPCASYDISYILQLSELDFAGLFYIVDGCTDRQTHAIPRGAFAPKKGDWGA